MRKLLLLLFIFIAIAVQPLTAQKRVELNVQAGLNLSFLQCDGIDARVKPGANIGFYMNINLTDWLFLQPGTLYSMKGGIDSYSGSKSNDKDIYNLHYIEIPAHIGFKVRLKRDITILLHTGPYIAAGIRGNVTYKYGGTSHKYNGFEENDFNWSDAGWNFGAGVRFRSLYGGLSYGHGMVNISQNGDWHGYRNRNLSISLGYYF